MSQAEKAIAKLFSLACKASENAYAPYSRARVGACVLDDKGKVHTGCNVENASYGLTQCAERNALASAIGAGMKPRSAHTLLVYATGFDALAPCGACRQVMCELMADDAVIISCHSETDYRSWSMSELLPDAFKLS